MDIKTIDKIIKILDRRIRQLEKDIEDAPLHGYDLDFLQGKQVELKDFVEHLRKLTVIHTELNKEE
jgi:hypothetical protein